MTRIIGVRLDDEALTLLDELAKGRSRSEVIREAIRFTSLLKQLIERLDRIESLLAATGTRQPPAAPAENAASLATRAAVIAFALGDDD